MPTLAYQDDLEDKTPEELLTELTATLMAQERQRLRSFSEFVRSAWHVVEPTVLLTWNWHLDVICDDLEDLFHSRILREIINVPPGTAKSLVASVLFRGWVWTQNPASRFLTGSYGAHLSLRDNDRVRTLVNSKWYQERWGVGSGAKNPVTLVTDAKGKLETSATGWSIATSVDGVGTGEHPDFTIIDDPLTPGDVESDVEIANANNWVDKTLSTRGIMRGVRLLLIMQRLHVQDTTAHLKSKTTEGLRHRVFPMRYVPETRDAEGKVTYTPDPKDPRQVPGELLMPQLLNEQRVKQLEADLGPYGTAGQLQQNPVVEGGGLFRREWFKFVDVRPAHPMRRVRGWDTAGTELGGDWTCGVRLSEDEEERIYVEHVARKQVADAEAFIVSVAKEDGKSVAQREEKEGGASGKAVIMARAKKLKGYDYQGVVLSTGKIERAKGFRTQCAAGNVFLVRGEWNTEYLDELCAFPVGTHDDQVDGSSAAYNALILEPRKRKVSLTWGRRR